jgi:hypothetical protein
VTVDRHHVQPCFCRGRGQRLSTGSQPDDDELDLLYVCHAPTLPHATIHL